MLLFALGCTNTTLSIPEGDVANPATQAEPLPSASETLSSDFDPIDPGAKPAAGHEHNRGAMPMPETAPKPDPMPKGEAHEMPPGATPMPEGHQMKMPTETP